MIVDLDFRKKIRPIFTPECDRIIIQIIQDKAKTAQAQLKNRNNWSLIEADHFT